MNALYRDLAHEDVRDVPAPKMSFVNGNLATASWVISTVAAKQKVRWIFTMVIFPFLYKFRCPYVKLHTRRTAHK